MVPQATSNTSSSIKNQIPLKQFSNVTHSPLTHRQYHDFFVQKLKSWSFTMGKGSPRIQKDVGRWIIQI